MFDRVQVSRKSRPDHRVHLLLLEKVSDDASKVSRSVVMLGDRSLANCIKRRKSYRAKDAVSVADPVQVVFQQVQGSPRVKANASPDHEGPAAIAIMFMDGRVQEPLSIAPPDPVPTIVKGEGVPGLVCEEHPGPLGPRPPHMRPAPGKTPLSMGRGEADSNSRPP